MLHGSLGAMEALATGGFAASPAQAAGGMVPLTSMSLKNYHQVMAKVLARTERIAVPSYRFGLVMRNGMGAEPAHQREVIQRYLRIGSVMTSGK